MIKPCTREELTYSDVILREELPNKFHLSPQLRGIGQTTNYLQIEHRTKQEEPKIQEQEAGRQRRLKMEKTEDKLRKN